MMYNKRLSTRRFHDDVDRIVNRHLARCRDVLPASILILAAIGCTGGAVFNFDVLSAISTAKSVADDNDVPFT